MSRRLLAEAGPPRLLLCQLIPQSTVHQKDSYGGDDSGGEDRPATASASA